MSREQSGILPEPAESALSLVLRLTNRARDAAHAAESAARVPARRPAALIGREDRAFAGGSCVFTQRYVHDLAHWAGLATREQEAVIGRRKRDSREIPDRAKPANAHIARVVIEEDGNELEILRRSYPYGTTSEHGLFFIAYTRDLAIPEKMLRRMHGTGGPSDDLMEFTRAVSGATFFAPSLPVLRKLATR